MVNRRSVLTGLALMSLASASPAYAQEWKAQYPELIFAVTPTENAEATLNRWEPMVQYLEREIGTKITLRIVPDYAAVIEGQAAGNVHIAWHGASSYARARMTGVPVDAFAINVNPDGSTGYYSVFYVKAESPFKKIEDLRGKNLGLVDPNSTSGNNVPRFALNKMGIRPEEFFANVVYTGSHENALIALGQGTVDVAATWLNSETDSNLTRMAEKKMLRAEDFRSIFQSDLIMSGPYAYLSSLPEELKASIRNALLQAPQKDAEAVKHLFDGKQGSFTSVKDDAYLPVIELNKFVDSLRKG